MAGAWGSRDSPYGHDALSSGRLVRPVDHVARTEVGYCYLIDDPLRAQTEPLKSFREGV
jgi:hypothetical protein